jgi:predicted nucleic acid-binding protein
MMEKDCSCLFLDTTIQIEKVLGREERKREIQKNLKEKYVITSRYVLMEYIRTVVKDFYYIYNVLKEESSVEAAIDRIADEARGLLSLKRCLKIINRMYQSQGNDRPDRRELIKHFERYISVSLPRIFQKDIDEILNLIDCDISRVEFSEWNASKAPVFHCNRAKAGCRLLDFFKARKIEFNLIFSSLNKLPQKDQQLQECERALGEVFESEEKILGERNCWSLGDVIIAITMPPECLMYTTNKKHFQVFTEALRKKMFE